MKETFERRWNIAVPVIQEMIEKAIAKKLKQNAELENSNQNPKLRRCRSVDSTGDQVSRDLNRSFGKTLTDLVVEPSSENE